MKTRFKIGDKVVHVSNPEYKGTVTKTKYVPKKGFSFGDFQWLWLDDNPNPAGSTSDHFKLQEE